LIGVSYLLYVILQIPFFGPFDRNKHLIILNEAFQIPGNMPMLKFLHELDLLDAIVSLLDIIDIEYFKQFKRNY